MRNQQKLSVAIVGAGIGGLAVAAALRKYFIEPMVYEQADAFDRVGAGIQQSPNALKIHRWLGIEDQVRQVAFAPASSLNRDALSGKVTNDYPLGREVEARYGAPYLTLHRGDLHAALASKVPAQSVKFGKKLTHIQERGMRVALTFTDGSEVEVDAVIGADGVHSLIRGHVAGPEQPRFTGRLAYRTTFPSALLRGVDIGPSRTKWWGKDRHIVIYFVTAKCDEVYFTTSQPERADWMTKESWSTKGDLAEMRAAFFSFHSEVQRVLAAAPEVHKWGIYERDPLPTWSKGNVVLLGDACHPMTPYMASGAAMALEDAVVLARTIDEAETLEGAFRLYETTRKPRASAVQAGSSKNTWMRTETNPDWLYGYDASRVPLRTSLAAEASTYYES
jgi:2-polyprenyl-6-methoxyphenol hydroxylase-like FAD-dependent oxidoreductase